MQLQDILYSQGFGTRRVCAGLIQQGLVQVYASNDALAPVPCAQAATDFVADGLRFRVQGVVFVIILLVGVAVYFLAVQRKLQRFAM
mgnify:CR=1 FL=1